MPKYLNTKDGSLESAVLGGVSTQAAIAISKRKRMEIQDMMMKVNH